MLRLKVKGYIGVAFDILSFKQILFKFCFAKSLNKKKHTCVLCSRAADPHLSIFPPQRPVHIPATKSIFSDLLRSHSHPNHLKQIHALILTAGLSVKNSLLTQILETLCNSGEMSYARNLFDDMHKPRIFLWNTITRGYVRSSLYRDALEIYRDMRRLGHRPDEYTFPFVLKACAALLHIVTGMEAHAMAAKLGLGVSYIVCTELVLMYVKFGNSDDYADSVFESMGDGRDLVSWNAIIAAYSQSGRADKALAHFRRMKAAGVEPDAITLACALSACAYLGSFELGKKLHGGIRDGRLPSNIFVENALLDMYAKCGSMEDARSLFEQMPSRNVVSWTAIIGGYAINGDSQQALSLFSDMRGDGVRPNNVTMLNALSACSHAGLVTQGKELFRTISQPTIEHCAAMVDLLGRSGHLEDAYNFIQIMPMDPDAGVWGALLNACAINGNIDLGEIAADELRKLAPETPSYHILLSNTYAALGRWGDVEKVRESMRGMGLRKMGGYSSVELDGEVQVFYEGSRIQSKKMKRLLFELMGAARGFGYVPETRSALHDVEDEEKEVLLISHSERLAVVFGLMHFKNAESPLRIMKNLRVCQDCHEFCKYVSMAARREIIMRDKSRFHRFKEGKCSCGDFW
ncbi:Pentatricopeptide repeat-containing protein [Platanthera zijinensis]|uniref:Pentatricopeptide repeat-containing protein n=1 Tax=Platanthera zijinensis TaxID=2320716 RepID=A0AAP0BJ94_9ASPA